MIANLSFGEFICYQIVCKTNILYSTSPCKHAIHTDIIIIGLRHSLSCQWSRISLVGYFFGFMFYCFCRYCQLHATRSLTIALWNEYMIHLVLCRAYKVKEAKDGNSIHNEAMSVKFNFIADVKSKTANDVACDLSHNKHTRLARHRERWNGITELLVCVFNCAVSRHLILPRSTIWV